MAFSLSGEQKRRIEKEEEVRRAEEAYRAEVRERMASTPAEPVKSSSAGRKIAIVLVLLIVAYLILKQH
jgi:hypothetical protein